ncbi:MAG TPA: UDP-glucose 4-epimerase GalE [Magnetospirillaceae bacterium]
MCAWQTTTDESESSQTVLVTGGAGYIGSHVCKALRNAGYLPVTYDDLSGGHRWAVRWGPFEKGSLSDTARLDAVMRRHSPVAVIHMAGLIAAGDSVVNPMSFYDTNVTGTLALLASMRRNGVKQIVFSSSAAVYGEPQTELLDESHRTAPINPYGAGKLVCERILQDFSAAYGIRALSLRYFNAVGADPEGQIGEAHIKETHLIPLVLAAASGHRPSVTVYGTDYPTPDGTCIRDYVHVSDLAAAHVLGIPFLKEQPGNHIFNLGNGAGSSVRQVIEAARRVTGKPIMVQLKDRRPGDPAVLVADATQAKKVLGWQPAYAGLETQIETAWKWTDIAYAIVG